MMEEGEEGEGNPMAEAKAMKDALATGGVDKMADVGAKSAQKLAKGLGGMAMKGFGSFF